MDLIIIFLAKNGNSKKKSLDHTDPLTGFDDQFTLFRQPQEMSPSSSSPYWFISLLSSVLYSLHRPIASLLYSSQPYRLG